MPKAGDTSFSPAGTSPASFTIDSHFFPGGVLAWRSRGCPGVVDFILRVIVELFDVDSEELASASDEEVVSLSS